MGRVESSTISQWRLKARGGEFRRLSVKNSWNM
jgi:hypothetical protein